MSDPLPVILTVDDETEVLRAVQRDLRSRYSAEYRIIGAGGGREAIDAINELSTRGGALALILADQRMPQVSGVDVLRASLAPFPAAKRALLTAYADTDAAISAINDVGLDHYIMKPWDPPEEKLYPILDDLLDDWQADYRPSFSGIRIVSHEWSKEAFELKAFLAMNQVPYRSFVVGVDPEAETLMESAGASNTDLPLFLFPEGPPLLHPTQGELAGRIGLKSHASSPAYDVAIVGAGPAGLAAAVYGASEGLATLLIEASAPGGQAGQSSLIENYLGFPRGISGADLARRAAAQATRFGAEILVPARVEKIERKDPYKIVHLDDGTSITTKAMVITSGVEYRRLEAEGLDDLVGAGVYYGTSRIEAENHRNQPMFVVGGGNSAGQAALFLTRFTDDVTIVIRGESLVDTMSAYLIENLEANDSITLSPRSAVVAARGDQHLESLSLEDLDTHEVRELAAGALFIFIGQRAQTDWLQGIVQLDDRGFVLTGAELGPLKGWNVDREPFPLESSVPGIFVAGDVRHGSIRRVAGATGEGATAIRFVHRHLASL
ncbi:MAG TPA: FAD-dependent oxidoreductase [Acidimicrobiia bacterium]|nr:FAD-dependent oxidoreductase [Acidimicrobiia bacterium]